MIYNPRFNYTPIKRTTENGKRLYTTPAGDRVPSVTTILSLTKPQEAVDQLKQWRNNVGHARADAITQQAANRGTKMHTYLEYFIRDGVLADPPTNPFHQPSHLMAATVIKEGLAKVDEIWGVEVPIYMPQMYAGTTDSVGLHEGDEAIIDFKQTNRPKRTEWIDDYRLQLAAYAIAHNEIHGTRIRKGVIQMCVKPKTDPNGIVLLNEDGSLQTPPQYQEFVIEGAEFDYWSNQWWHRLELYYSALATM
jgi:genome maintenance exonuclease 1